MMMLRLHEHKRKQDGQWLMIAHKHTTCSTADSSKVAHRRLQVRVQLSHHGRLISKGRQLRMLTSQSRPL